jgi:sugar-specific transcriptional regulator TrmB
MDYKLLEKIEKLGLSAKEARVYAFLLESRGAYPSKVASETKLNRSTVYKILTGLAIKGLASEIEHGKKIFYQPEPLLKLNRYIEYQVERAKNARDLVTKIMPELETLFTKSENPKVSFYKGKEQVIEAYLRHVQVEKPYKMTAFANVQFIKKFLPEKVFNFYKKEKERIGIIARGITSSNTYSYEFQKDTHSGIRKNIWPDLRFIPEEIFPFSAEMTMFDNNKVSIVKFEKQDPIAIIIEDKMVHDMMNMLFEYIWKRAEVK